MNRFLILLSTLVLAAAPGKGDIHVSSSMETVFDVNLYKVGDTDGSSVRLLDDYVGIEVPERGSSKDMKDCAQAVYGRIRGSGKKADYTVKLNKGVGSFKDVPYGVYLVSSDKWQDENKTYGVIPALVIFDQNVDSDFHMDLKMEITDRDPEETASVTVVKKWVLRNNEKAVPVTMELLRNGAVTDEIELNEKNNWTYTWAGLDKGSVWTVKEPNVPEGFVAELSENDGKFVITNTSIQYLKVKPQTGLGSEDSFRIIVLSLAGLIVLATLIGCKRKES